jgi:hypothetical protein
MNQIDKQFLDSVIRLYSTSVFAIAENAVLCSVDGSGNLHDIEDYILDAIDELREVVVMARSIYKES